MCMSSINRCPSGLVIAFVLDDIHIYDMFLLFINRCPSGLVIACVLDDIHIYEAITNPARAPVNK
jgi:hypothetical protein